MFQLGSLVVLCGLLIPTSESPLGSLQSLLLDMEPGWSEVKASLQEALSSVNLDRLINLLYTKAVGFEIKDFKFLDLEYDRSSNGDGIILKIPLVLDASLSLPFPDSTADVSVSMEMVTSLAVQKDGKTDRTVLVMKECSTNPDKISIDLLNRRNRTIKTFLNTVFHSARRSLSLIVDQQVCPQLHAFFSSLHDDIISKLVASIST